MQAEELPNKFVAVLSKKIPVGNLMNALGHMTAGLVGSYPNVPDMRFDSYFDQNGGEHKSLSDNPFIVLAADNSNQLRTLRNALIAEGIHFTDFADTMVEGTYVEQKERTKVTPEAELQYYGVCAFGNKEVLTRLTKKFSLWK